MGSRLEKNSSAVRKRIEEHTFSGEDGEEYEPSAFGGFSDYFRRKKIKLQNLDADMRASAPDKPQIFKGVVAHVSGYTQPPLHVLHKELVQHGAGFLQYLDGKTMATHIIASSLPPKKAVEFSRYRIVKPAWVVDSIKAGKVLPWNEYRLIDEGPRQKTIQFDGGRLFSQSTQKTQPGYREQTQNSFYAGQFQQTPSKTDAASGDRQATLQQVESIEDDDAMDFDMLPSMQKSRLPEQGPPEAPSEAPTDPGPSEAEKKDVEPEALLEDVSKAESEDRQTKSEIPEVASGSTAPKPRQMTSEEHNALLLADPHIRKSSTANPDFIRQYYSESRLHHLSTWKADLKSKMQRLAAQKRPVAKVLKKKLSTRRYIMHVDFDSFFCAVSLKKHPEWADKPAVVAHGTGTGSEIASCNYPAREFGVKNGMWMKKALDLCPNLKVLPYDFPAYEDASQLFYEAILDVGGVVQSVSIDEALVDVTSIVLSGAGSEGVGIDEGSIWREQAKADELATDLRQRIKSKTGCNVSIGIGANILLAKVALRKAKPAGQYQIKPEEVLSILGELNVESLPGVAYSIGGKLEEIGVKYVKDIRDITKERLVSVLGPKTGEKLWEYARGIDRTEVGDQPIRKSVSAEVNWGIRFISQEEAEEFVLNLCKELEKRLLNEQVKGKNLTMKIMRRSSDAPLDPPKHLGHGKCDTFNKSIAFGVATNDARTIGKEAVAILRSFKFTPGDLRGIGVQLTKLEPIKATTTAPDGSQKRISFGAPAAAQAKRTKAEPIEDEPGVERNVSSQGRSVDADPIADDPLTPRKPKISPVHPAFALSKAGEADAKATTPLNVTGTQFIMPSNADPAVLAELPQDIRSKLMAQQKRAAQVQDESPSIRSRTQSPAVVDEVPPDIDPEVFNALPDEMKAEVLASYGRRPGQTVLPQSPRRDRVVHQASPKKTPTKGGIRGMFGRARERQHDAEARLQQTSFLPTTTRETECGTGDGGGGGSDDALLEELDPEFLAELPEEVRKEVIADHKQRRMAQRSGLNFQAPQRRGTGVGDGAANLLGGQTKLQFPPKPPKISFTNASLTSVPEIKDMLNAWHRQTRDEGPHRTDVEMFERYLKRVVTEEKDMDKARKLVTWLDWVVEEDTESNRRGRRGWRSAVVSIKAEVQTAVRERGLGPMKFT